MFQLSSGHLFAQTEANAFLDDSKVQTLNVTMDPADWAALVQNYELDTYYHATMTWNGMSVSLGIRSHGGGGNHSAVKPNLDFNFAHYTKGQTFLGLPFILVKANNQDASTLHEWISMTLYRKMGLPAPREAPTQLFINGQLLGFYFIVEHLDETYLQRNFGESTGYLYEWEYGQDYEFGNLGTNQSSYAAFLDLKTDQSSPDLQTFVNFIQAVNVSPANESTYISGLALYMDPKLFLSYCATENLLAEEDGVLDGISGLNNFYLYQFNGTTLYQMLAWDKDRTFSDPHRDILDGVTSGTYVNLLAQVLYTFPDYKLVYLSELNRAAALFEGTGGWADAELNREYGVIRSAALNDPNKQCDYSGAGAVPCGTKDFESGIEAMQTFIAQRSDSVLQSSISAGCRVHWNKSTNSRSADRRRCGLPGADLARSLGQRYGNQYGAFGVLLQPPASSNSRPDVRSDRRRSSSAIKRLARSDSNTGAGGFSHGNIECSCVQCRCDEQFIKYGCVDHHSRYSCRRTRRWFRRCFRQRTCGRRKYLHLRAWSRRGES